MEPLFFLPVYALVGLVAGTAAGLLGVGGGLIIVPALAVLFHYFGIDEHRMQLAVGTSLATIAVTAITSVIAHQKQGAIQWTVFWRLSPGVMFGAIAGAYLASQLPSELLKVAFGLIEIAVALQIMRQLKPKQLRQLPGDLTLGAVGSVIGFISAVVGIGGGTLTVPYLVWCNTAIQKAIATSAACGLPIALAGSLAYVVFGYQQGVTVAGASGFVYWPAFFGIVVTSMLAAPYGARLTHRLPTKQLSKVFAWFLLFVGVSMLIS